MNPSEPFSHAPPEYPALPVSVLGEPVRAIRQPREPGKSGKLCDGSISIQPVVDAQKNLVGVFSQETMTQPGDSVGRLISDFPKLVLGATLVDAQALFAQGDWSFIPLVNFQGRYTGQCASRQRLLDFLNGQPRPVRIGGLATPLGVYMTSGAYIAGAGWNIRGWYLAPALQNWRPCKG